jgi:hypothetical protein
VGVAVGIGVGVSVGLGVDVGTGVGIDVGVDVGVGLLHPAVSRVATRVSSANTTRSENIKLRFVINCPPVGCAVLGAPNRGQVYLTTVTKSMLDQ